MHAPSRKTDSVRALLVPGKRMSAMKLQRFKNSDNIVQLTLPKSKSQKSNNRLSQRFI